MMSTSALIFSFAVIPYAFGGHQRNWGQPSIGAFDNSNLQSFDNKFSNAHGSGASAGQANARKGNAISINTANHEASNGRTRTDAMSSNAASGWDPSAGGAAQAGGGVQSGRERGSMFNRNSGISTFRRKRQAFGYFGGSGSSANSLGGGRVGFGSIRSRNDVNTYSNPYSASGYASGSAEGEGYGADIWNAATSNSYSGRRKRHSGNPWEQHLWMRRV